MPKFRNLPFVLCLLLVFGVGCSSSPKSDPAEEIKKVMQQFDAISQEMPTTSRDDTPESVVQKTRDFVSKVKALDCSKCPDDFQSAFNEVRDVMSKLGDLTVKMADFKKTYDANRIVASNEYQAAIQEMIAIEKEMQDAVFKLQTVSQKYGVAEPTTPAK